MSVTKTLSLTTGKQLLDLNGGSINFDLTFSAKSLDNSPFDAIVVDQSTLDSNVNLDFQHANDGVISANIVSDKNVYQNYYLCLKSDKPCQVEVVIDKKEIKANLPPLNTQNLKPPIKPSKTNWMLIGVVIILFALLGVYYYYYIYNKKNNKIDDDVPYSNKIFDTSTPQHQSKESENKTNFSERLANLLR
jgi:hypothetical protein